MARYKDFMKKPYKHCSLSRETDMAEAVKQIDAELAGQWSDHFDASIKAESERARVILSACYLEELLFQLLAIALKPCPHKQDPLFHGATAPLGTFSAKIEMAARMCLIPEDTEKSLQFVRKIRNRFAHDLAGCNFSDPQILDWNREMHLLNNHATPERRATFSDGSVGDFEKSVSWLIFWIKYLTQGIPSECPCCGSEMEHREKLKLQLPEKSYETETSEPLLGR